jgi:hypothetical protein
MCVGASGLTICTECPIAGCISRNLESAVLSFRRHSNSRTLFRRQVLALLIGGASCLPAIGEDSENTNPVPPSTASLKIRSATKSWTDEGKTIAFQPALRFRAPTNASDTDTASTQVQREANAKPSGALNAGIQQVDDNWVARDAINLKQPLRDPMPPSSATAPSEQVPVPNKVPMQARVATAPAPTELQRPKAPQVTPSSPASGQNKAPSANLLPPKAYIEPSETSPSVAPNTNNVVGGLGNNSLQLVAPNEMSELKSFGTPTRTSPNDVTDEPVVEVPENSSQPSKSETAVESILSKDSDGPSLDAATESVETEDRDEVTCEGESDPKLLDLDEAIQSLDEMDDQENETETSRNGIKYRRLTIDRDGSPATGKIQQESIAPRPTQRSTDRPREIDGNNEPLQKLEPSAPELNEEETPRLQEAPISPPKAVDTAAPLEQLDYTGRPTGRLQVTAAVRRLQPMMKSCLSYYYATPENATERSNWGMMHQIMVYGVDTNIIAGRNKYNAIAWIAGNNACRGQRILTTGPRGLQAKNGIGLQGHQGQLLAVLSICGVPDSYPLYVSSQKFYIRDLIREEMATCKSGEELTFTLIGLSHYLDTDQKWQSADGQAWDFEKLIQEELSQPIVGSACGGTHRLMGFAHALRNRRLAGKEISGQWLRAEKFLEEFVAYTYQLQNRDGSMSTNWFEGPQDNGDLDRKVQTTGHMVEWLLTNTPNQELQNPRLVSAIQFLLNSLNSDRKHDWQIGPKGHALRSLAMYYDRVYQSDPAWANVPAMARSADTRRR